MKPLLHLAFASSFIALGACSGAINQIGSGGSDGSSQDDDGSGDDGSDDGGNASAVYEYFAFGVSGDGLATTFSINATTGELTAESSLAVGDNPQAIVLDPEGRYAYVIDDGASDKLKAYSVDATTGALTFASEVSDVSSPAFMAIHPSGEFVYVTNYGPHTVSAFAISSADGSLTHIGDFDSQGTGANDIAISDDGEFLYVDNQLSPSIAAFAIDTATGELSALGSPVVVGSTPISVAITPSGKAVYAGNANSDFISQISLNADGSLGATQNVDIPTDSTAVRVAASGDFLFAIDQASGSVVPYAVDIATGALTEVPGGSATTSVAGPYILALDPRGNFVYSLSGGDVSVQSYDETGALQAGTATAVGANVYNLVVAPVRQN